MTAFALDSRGGMMAGVGTPYADGRNAVLAHKALNALFQAKVGGRAGGSSHAFHELRRLGSDDGTAVGPDLLALAERFLLGLPSTAAPPDVSLDDDGDVVFDWMADSGKMCTVALNAAGRVAYAVRISAHDKDYGTKRFVDEIPRQVVRSIEKVAC